MEDIAQFVVSYGYGLIVFWVLFDQLGVPIPAIPLLIVAGAMSGMGELEVTWVVAAATLGCLPSDILWFELGRRRGGGVLKTLCKVSLEPDSCVRSTESTFERYGAKSLLVAKLIPGYQTLSPALAGMSGMSLPRFLVFDIPGALLWSLLFVVPGYLLHDQLEQAFSLVEGFGTGLGAAVVVLLVSYVAWKFIHRQRLLHSLRVARIEPSELNRLLERGDEVAVIDLRGSMVLEYQPIRIPGAFVMNVEDLETRHSEIPRDRDVVLYCT